MVKLTKAILTRIEVKRNCLALFFASFFLVRGYLRELRQFLSQKIRVLLLLYSSLIAPAWVLAQWKIISIISYTLIGRNQPWTSKVETSWLLSINRGSNSTQSEICVNPIWTGFANQQATSASNSSCFNNKNYSY